MTSQVGVVGNWAVATPLLLGVASGSTLEFALLTTLICP